MRKNDLSHVSSPIAPHLKFVQTFEIKEVLDFSLIINVSNPTSKFFSNCKDYLWIGKYHQFTPWFWEHGFG